MLHQRAQVAASFFVADRPARVGRDARTLERDFQETVECELKRTVFFFTHRVSPSLVRLLASEPCKLRARRLIQRVRYHGEIGNPGRSNLSIARATSS